jgi:hypothetical protein
MCTYQKPIVQVSPTSLTKRTNRCMSNRFNQRYTIICEIKGVNIWIQMDTQTPHTVSPQCVSFPNEFVVSFHTLLQCSQHFHRILGPTPHNEWAAGPGPSEDGRSLQRQKTEAMELMEEMERLRREGSKVKL